MSTSAKQRDQFTVPLKCVCGQTGIAVWEDASTGMPSSQPYLVTLTDGFYERIMKKDRRSIELVCHNCGAVMPE